MVTYHICLYSSILPQLEKKILWQLNIEPGSFTNIFKFKEKKLTLSSCREEVFTLIKNTDVLLSLEPKQKEVQNK